MLAVRIDITDSLNGYGQFWNNTEEPITFTGQINLAKDYSGQTFSQQTPFSVTVPAHAVRSASATFTNTFLLNPLPALLLGTSGSFYNVPRSAFVNLSNVQPSINNNTFTGTFLNVEYGGVTTTAKTTFIYSTNTVPEGGSTVAMLGVALVGLSFRLRASRAWKECRA